MKIYQKQQNSPIQSGPANPMAPIFEPEPLLTELRKEREPIDQQKLLAILVLVALGLAALFVLYAFATAGSR